MYMLWTVEVFCQPFPHLLLGTSGHGTYVLDVLVDLSCIASFSLTVFYERRNAIEKKNICLDLCLNV